MTILDNKVIAVIIKAIKLIGKSPPGHVSGLNHPSNPITKTWSKTKNNARYPVLWIFSHASYFIDLSTEGISDIATNKNIKKLITPKSIESSPIMFSFASVKNLG